MKKRKDEQKFNGFEGGENVEKTIEDINKRHSERKKESTVLRILKTASIPFVKAGKRVRKTLSSVTVRAVAVYFLLSVFAVVLLSVVLLSMVKAFVFEQGDDARMFYFKLVAIACALGVFIVILVTALAYLSTWFALSPLRKMTRQIRSITANDLSKRLDEEASASELTRLAVEINKLLEDISLTFDRQKKFVSDASHELKTPIAVIQGYTALLLRWGRDDKEVLEESLQSLAKEAENMKNLVDRLLFLARLGQYLLDRRQVEMEDLLHRIADGYKLSRNREVVVDCPRLSFVTDESLLTECIRALIDNAIKYSDEDSKIEISAHREGKSLVLTVEDEGVGIAKDEIDKIFDRFYRCDNARTRDDKSCGLGLTICASIVQLLGGKIGVESEIGKGTTVKITLGGE